MSANLKALLAVTRLRLEVIKAKKIGGGYNRHPAGSSKGGQFAPKGAGGGMGAAGGGNTFHEVGGPGWGHYAKPVAPPPGAKPHPAGVNDKGQPVTVNYPTKPSGKDTWANKDKTATFVPGGETPSTLNNVPMKSWSPPKEGWHAVGGNNERLEALFPFERPAQGKSTGAGVLIVEPDGRIWLTKPTNEFGGYKQTYPKGTVESGLTMQQNAIKEAWEETGLKIKITGVLGDYDRTTSRARMYIAERVGGTPKDMGWESQAVRLSTMRDAKSLLNMSHDKKILADLEALLSITKAAGGKGGKGGHWQNQARWPAGSPLGGQWKATGKDGLTLPPTIAGGLAGKNSNYQKAVDAAHSAAQGGDVAPVKALIGKYIAKLDAFNAGEKGSSHLKWGAQCAQYGIQLLKDASGKPAAVATADRLSGPQKLKDLGPVTAPKPGGSNPGAIHTDSAGEKWLVKGSNAATGQDAATIADRSKNEVLAAKLALAAGAGAPEMKLVDLEGKYNGGVGVASKMIDGLTKMDPGNAAQVAAARQDFAVHAWLANYDVVGLSFDNLMFKDGKAINIDTGGALLFRAQGAKKDGSTGLNKDGVLHHDAPEFESMRNTNAQQKAIFGSMTKAELKASAEKLNNISDDTIKALVKTYGPGNDAFKEKLAESLIARKNAILDKAGLPFSMKVGDAAPTAAKPAPTKQDVEAALLAKAMKDVQATTTAVKNHVATSDKDIPAPKTTAMGKLGAMGNLVNNESLKTIGIQMDKAYAAGDMSGLAMAKAGADALSKSLPSINPVSMAAVALGVHAQQGMSKLAFDAVKAAQPIAAAAPKIDVPPKPEFPGKKFGETYYKGLADKAEALAAKGDLAGLKAMATSGKYEGGVPWKPGSANGKVMATYHAALVAKLEQKEASEVVARVKQAHTAMQKPVDVPTPAEASQKALPAMPNFTASKIPLDNKNAGTHNAKVDTLAGLAEKGDVNGILSLSYGVNTYGKKAAKLANDALAALGSPHVVTPGQKQNTHPALFGGVTAAEATKAAATVNVKPMPAHPATKQPVDLEKLDMSKAVAPPKPTFSASSKAWVNESNNKLAADIEQAFHAGNLTAVQAMSYQKIDKETGKPLGTAPISEHPAKEIKNYFDAVITQMREVAYPPQPLKHFDAKAAKSIDDLSKAFPSKKIGTTVNKVKNNEKLGFWVALGKVSNPERFMPPTTQNVTDADVQKAFSDYKKASPKVKEFIKGMQASGSYANAWRNGEKTDSYGNDLKTITKIAADYAQSKPEGTKVYRYQQMSSDMVEKMLSTGPGTIIQATGPMPTSYSETATSGFGPHKVTIIFAKGAKAVDSHGSGGFPGEKEITMLPNSRFVLLKAKKGKNGKLDIQLLLLPPDLGIDGTP